VTAFARTVLGIDGLVITSSSRRELLDHLKLVGMSEKQLSRLSGGDVTLLEGEVCGDYLPHSRFERRKVIRRERPCRRQCVINLLAIIIVSAKGKGGAGQYFKHGLGRYVGQRVTKCLV
jgi:hypothetical protein